MDFLTHGLLRESLPCPLIFVQPWGYCGEKQRMNMNSRQVFGPGRGLFSVGIWGQSSRRVLFVLQ